MVDIKDLKPVELGHRDLFREHYRKYPIEHSDYLHGIMCTWKHYMRYSFALMDDSILIVGEHEGKMYMRSPVGPLDKKVFEEALTFSREQGFEPLFAMVGERTARFLEKEFPELETRPHRDYFDYIYLSSDLRDLQGKRYLKIRNYLNKFRKQNDHSVEPVSLDNKDEIHDFLVRWCERKGCQDVPFLMQERQATMFGIDNFFDLGFEGLCIRVNGQVEAFSIFEEMRSDMAVVHFEKANFDIPGLYQAVNNEAAKLLAGKYRFMNRESDMGVPGLRKAKEKYRPDHMMKVSHCRMD
ncbi:MAG: phosphatidylglycerol lysyltransferase domain-containing protein [Candidatus Thermoplasmatota archaeon]|nr:phosphatidylglycerol lysyltransferase domain-containing protein [Candidatus Thermoplasmatota archaeon]